MPLHRWAGSISIKRNQSVTGTRNLNLEQAATLFKCIWTLRPRDNPILPRAVLIKLNVRLSSLASKYIYCQYGCTFTSGATTISQHPGVHINIDPPLASLSLSGMPKSSNAEQFKVSRRGFSDLCTVQLTCWNCTTGIEQFELYNWFCTVGTVQLVCTVRTLQLVLYSWNCTTGHAQLELYNWYCTSRTVQLVLNSWFCRSRIAQLVLNS